MPNLAISYDALREEWRAKNYPWYSAPFDLNLFGIRAKNALPDHFDDTLGLAWRDDNGNRFVFQVPGTTDPGAFYLGKHSINPHGTAILVPGHYPRMYRPGLHRGRYRALVQVKPCTIVRDSNQDGKLDFAAPTVETGLFGINFHRAQASGTTFHVGPHSAGCQVVQRAADLAYVLAQVEVQQQYLHSRNVSYTLLYEPELTTI